MKNTIKVLGVIALAAIIGFSMAACDNGSGGGGNNIPPESWSVQDRWWSWKDDTSTATTTHSVANDVCTITVSGTIETEAWKASAGYVYTGKKDTAYEYTFEAWTESGNRTLNVQYYYNHNDKVYLEEMIKINDTRKSYTIYGDVLPKDGQYDLTFQCADQLGTFYVKILSIKTSQSIPPENWSVKDRWWSWKDDTSTATTTKSVANDGVCTITVNGTAETAACWNASAGYAYTGRKDTAYKYTFEAWTASGSRTLKVQYYYDEGVGLEGSIPSVTTARTTYTITGDVLPKNGRRDLTFQCADQLGTFYVKIISINAVN